MSKLSTIGRHPGVLLVGRIVIGLVFIAASMDKIAHPDQFVEVIMGYKIVPWTTAMVIGIWLPWVELVVGTIILIGIWVRAGALLLSGLTVIFIGALSSALLRNIDIQCGCFSVSELTQARSVSSLWQEMVLLLGCIWLWWGHWPAVAGQRQQIPDTQDSRTTEV